MSIPTTMETTSGSTPLPFMVGSPLFYMVVGAGSILAVLIICIVVLSLCIGCVCLQRNRATSTRQLEDPEVYKSSDMTMLSKEVGNTIEVSTTAADGQIKPQCYTIEENPAYTASATCALRQDHFNYEANPAYTLVEAPHQKQGIPFYHEILSLVKAEDTGREEYEGSQG